MPHQLSQSRPEHKYVKSLDMLSETYPVSRIGNKVEGLTDLVPQGSHHSHHFVA